MLIAWGSVIQVKFLFDFVAPDPGLLQTDLRRNAELEASEEFSELGTAGSRLSTMSGPAG